MAGAIRADKVLFMPTSCDGSQEQRLLTRP